MVVVLFHFSAHQAAEANPLHGEKHMFGVVVVKFQPKRHDLFLQLHMKHGEDTTRNLPDADPDAPGPQQLKKIAGRESNVGPRLRMPRNLQNKKFLAHLSPVEKLHNGHHNG